LKRNYIEEILFVEGLHNTNELLEMFNQASWNKTKIFLFILC